MGPRLSPHLLAQLSQRIEAWMGVFFPPERWLDLERKLHAAAADFGCADAAACARLLVTSPITKPQLELLASHLTVGETYFFREPASLDIVEHHILPRLLQERRATNRRVRLWSAACCTGEEPYSLAIILHRLLPDLPSWNITLLATDINAKFLRKAAEGVYGQWSFRNVPPALRERYFCQTPNGRYALQPTIKQMVKFAQLNLANDHYAAPVPDARDMDVILCRNVLIYFSADRAKQVIENCYRALAPGGWLIVSAVETALVMESSFTPVSFAGAMLFRKDPEPDASYRATATNLLASCASETALDPEADTLLITEDTVPSHAVTPAMPRELTPQTYEEALSLYDCGRYAETIEKLSALCWDGPADTFPAKRAQGLTLLTRAYANRGQLAEAQVWCERALALNTLDPVLHYLRATIALEYGQEAEARSSLTRAVSLDQRFVLAHFILGVIARQRHDRQEAREHFSEALRLLRQYHPDDILPDSEGMSAGRLAHMLVEMNEEL